MAIADDITALPTAPGDGHTGHTGHHVTIHAALKSHENRLTTHRHTSDEITDAVSNISYNPNCVLKTNSEGKIFIPTDSITGSGDPTNKSYVDSAVGAITTSLSTKAETAYVDQQVKDATWDGAQFLNDNTDVENLTSGLYEVRNTPVARALGMPTPTSGSLWVHHFAIDMGVMEWRPTSRREVYLRRKHGSTWGEFELISYAQETAIDSTTPVEDLSTGLYRVSNGTVATALGLPTAASGSLWIHRMDAGTGRMEWRPTNSNDAWVRRLHGSGWQAWVTAWDALNGKPSTFPPATHDHDTRYYTKGEIDTRTYTKTEVDNIVSDAAPAEPTGEITGVNLSLENTGIDFVPDSIGVDGLVYGHLQTQTFPVRSADGVSTDPEYGPRISEFSEGGGIVHVERTSEGFVLIVRYSSTQHKVFFSPDWMGPYEEVLELGSWLLTAWTKPRLIAGTTWMVISEYTNAIIPSFPMKRFLSTDGGQSFEVILETTPINDQVNSHCHTSLIRGDGRIYASDGDGINNWFGYSDDRGKSWVPVPIDPAIKISALTYSQPTLLIDFGESIFTSPDAGPYQPGMWRMDPDTHQQEIVWDLAHGGPYGDASKQYGRSVYAQAGAMGKEAYALFPPAGSGNREAFVAATPDGGKRWGVVATIPLGSSGSLSAGVVGPDLHGNIYMRGGDIPNYGTNIIRAKAIDWSKIDY